MVGGGQWSRVFFSYFPPLKPRYVIWSSASYSLKIAVYIVEKLENANTCGVEFIKFSNLKKLHVSIKNVSNACLSPSRQSQS